MKAPDTMDKIVNSYFAPICKEEFEYKGVRYKPHPLVLSPLMFRDFTCPPNCGGCCPRFSLDYLPSEAFPYSLTKRLINFNGASYSIYSDLQTKNENHHCVNLDMHNGRCKVYEERPFSCDFELLGFTVSKQMARPNYLRTRIYSRGWNFLRSDNKRGALCEVTPSHSHETIYNISRKLVRLKSWSDFFKIKTNIKDILNWVKTGPHLVPTVIYPGGKKSWQTKLVI